jgi:dimethylaniline monooxygenase (N-oxide forming)
LTSNGAKFVDGSEETFSKIIYATGYHHSYPFLSVDSGLTSVNKKVYPLYKHCLNINNPTLAIIGLPYPTLTMPLYDLQIRFALQYWTKRKSLPSKEEMLDETNRDIEERKSKGLGDTKTHFIIPSSDYVEDMAATAGIEDLKPVIKKISCKMLENIFFNFENFRKYHYRIINDDEFECEFHDD